MTLPIIQLSGSPYEQGRQHGQALRSRITHNMDVYYDRFLRESGLSREQVLQRAERYADAIAAGHPDYYEGMKGIAQGAGASLADIVALNVRYEILYYEYAQSLIAAADGCTAFALAPDATASGHLLLGQNWDWIPEVQGAVLHTKHSDGLQTLTFTEAGIFGGKIGLNSAGLGLVINGITTTADDWTRLHSPFHVRCYQILRSRSLAEAEAVVGVEERACSANYLIAALPDQAVDLEAAPGNVNRLLPQEGCLVHANHFVDPHGTGIVEPPDPDVRRWSCRRQERLQELLGKRPVAVDEIQHYLRDHTTPPRDICRHEDPAAPIDEQYRTVTSIIIDLNEGWMLASDGPPCENDYQRFALAQ